ILVAPLPGGRLTNYGHRGCYTLDLGPTRPLAESCCQSWRAACIKRGFRLSKVDPKTLWPLSNDFWKLAELRFSPIQISRLLTWSKTPQWRRRHLPERSLKRRTASSPLSGPKPSTMIYCRMYLRWPKHAVRPNSSKPDVALFKYTSH